VIDGDRGGVGDTLFRSWIETCIPRITDFGYFFKFIIPWILLCVTKICGGDLRADIVFRHTGIECIAVVRHVSFMRHF